VLVDCTRLSWPDYPLTLLRRAGDFGERYIKFGRVTVSKTWSRILEAFRFTRDISLLALPFFVSKGLFGCLLHRQLLVICARGICDPAIAQISVCGGLCNDSVGRRLGIRVLCCLTLLFIPNSFSLHFYYIPEAMIGDTKILDLNVAIPYYNTTMITESNIHLLTTALTLLLPLLAFYIHYDYKAFLSLGPGGTPATPLGYLKIKLLSLVCLRDPLRPMPIPPHFRPQTGYFDTDSALPRRKGERPRIQGIAPQRQQTQKSSEAVYKSLLSKLNDLVTDPRNQLMERTSCFEKHSSGIFASTPIMGTCGGEICHAHASDGSMHLTLHPSDAKLMLENGWGERHPLARGGWCRRFVPKEFVLVYAPRDEDEVEIVMKIVAASIWWVSGIDVNGDETGPRRRSADVEAVGKAMADSECWTCKMRSCGGGKAERVMGDT
jgi:hypothetical protein